MMAYLRDHDALHCNEWGRESFIPTATQHHTIAHDYSCQHKDSSSAPHVHRQALSVGSYMKALNPPHASFGSLLCLVRK